MVIIKNSHILIMFMSFQYNHFLLMKMFDFISYLSYFMSYIPILLLQ